jgi:cytochrome c oxidase cbb3-type subunit 3
MPRFSVPLSSSILLPLALVLSATSARAAEAAIDGGRLYTQHCSACHGTDGHGGVGVPIALPAFLSSVDDDYLRLTIRHGRPGRVMPGFPSLTRPEVDAIVSHIRHWSAQHAGPVLTHDPIRGKVTHGRELFGKYCAACHGANGEGGHGTGVTFSRPRSAPILAPALNNAGFLASASDALIQNTLLRGREGTPMTSFLKLGLSKQDINDVVAYVRSFQKTGMSAELKAADPESPVIVRESPYTLEETIEKVKIAVGAANLRLIRVQTLDQGLVPESKENPDQTIIYSCDFKFLNEALQVDPRVGLFLPCRVTVVRREGKIQVMSINPKRLSRIFNNAELDQLCDRMYEVYVNIIEESVL